MDGNKILWVNKTKHILINTKTKPYKSYPTGKQILPISGLYLYVYNSGLEKKHTCLPEIFYIHTCIHKKIRQNGENIQNRQSFAYDYIVINSVNNPDG